MLKRRVFMPDPRLHIVRDEPLNAETPLSEQIGVITPNALFYVRNHGAVPALTADSYRLDLVGEFERPLALSYADLLALPAHSLLVTLECAGNGRSHLHPLPPGEPWELGAVSTAEWTGVPLAVVLEMAGLSSRATELVFTGADECDVPDLGHRVPFERSLSVADAFDPEVLLAYAMNGEPLPPQHGYPLRLVVPGWYGVASVKWLVHIEAIQGRFDGYYQRERYVLSQPGRETTPLSKMRTRSLILTPIDRSSVPRGRVRIAGVAWSGEGKLESVQVSLDGGATFHDAAFVSAPEPYAWRRWEYFWEPTESGTYSLESRAFDDAGHTQPRPSQQDWNRFGYGNNAIESVKVTVL